VESADSQASPTVQIDFFKWPFSKPGKFQAVRSNRQNVVWALRLIVVASLLAPALLFAYATWANYRAIERQTSERIERALDVIQEHALRTLQTIERTIAETNEVLRGLSDAEIRADEERLSRRLRRTQEALPQLQSIWAFDAAGHPLLSSTILPVPRTLNNSDRDYFQAHLEQKIGTYIGDIVTARVGSLRFFVVSGRRPETANGDFNGVIGITVLPDHFREFYARLSRAVADSFGLIRADGAFLARYPAVLNRPERLNPQSVFGNAIQTQPEAGAFTAVSQLDGIERQIGYRKVPGYPVYVQAGIETGAAWRALESAMLGHLAFGLPASLVMFGLGYFALRRTKRFHAEVGRREIAEAALKQAQRLEAIGQLTGGVAHDFNNLLMVVTGNAERIRREPLSDSQTRALDAIGSAAKRGASLTRQLLSFSRRQTHEPVVIKLADRLPELEDMLRSSLRGDIAIDLKMAEGLWPAKVDASEFELAVLNIAVNARDAMTNGGRLTIAAQNVHLSDPATMGLQGDYVAVSFSDTGTGIPPDIVGRVFEPFFTTKEVGKGTGLGLSQVYGFARQSGGTATASSEPGRGTTITLYLPRTKEREESGAAPAEVLARMEGRGRILLVEDNAEVAEVTRANLADLGFDVTYAGDAAAALVALECDGRFDLVFTDIVMPGAMNGLDLARRVADIAPSTAVLLATGYSNVAQTVADQGFAILHKPYRIPALSEAVRNAIRAKRFRVVA
jgi:two-component system, NtrC family, sensor kinase